MNNQIQRPNLLKTHPTIQKLQWIIDPVGYLDRAGQQYPDLFTGDVVGFGGTTVFVSHPQGIQEIFTNPHKKYAAPGELNRTLQPILGDHSLFMLGGDRHKRQRKLMMPPFHGERMRSYGDLIANIANQVFQQLSNQPFLAQTVTQDISLQIMLQAVFGLSEGEVYQRIKQLVIDLISDVFGSPLTSSLLLFPSLQKDLGPWSAWGKFLRCRQQLDQLLFAEIAQRRSHPNPNRIDILSLLMSARDEEGEAMTDQELRDELMTLLVAGHETTATAMAWAFYWVHYLPEVREKLLEELDNLGDSPDLMSILRAPYLNAVCNESLRIYPVGMFTTPRIVKESTELLGQRLAPGTIISACIYLTHHREDIYPNSHQFRPERFLEKTFSPSEFIPFGGGVRGCVGQALAMCEMKLVLATILSSYKLSLLDSQPEKPQRRGVTIGPARGVKMVITGRRTRAKSLVTPTAISAF
ncbi:cytochrome P450 [Calothrix membranacea FACHB-236]|nr:cytochrome P450 [Calothrix membranacea FACHB-236]